MERRAGDVEDIRLLNRIGGITGGELNASGTSPIGTHEDDAVPGVACIPSIGAGRSAGDPKGGNASSAAEAKGSMSACSMGIEDDTVAIAVASVLPEAEDILMFGVITQNSLSIKWK